MHSAVAFLDHFQNLVQAMSKALKEFMLFFGCLEGSRSRRVVLVSAPMRQTTSKIGDGASDGAAFWRCLATVGFWHGCGAWR